MRKADRKGRILEQIHGVHPTTNSSYFSGRPLPHPPILEKIIKVLNPDESRDLLDAYLQAQFPSLDYAEVLAGKARPLAVAVAVPKKKKKLGKKVACKIKKVIQDVEKEEIEKTIQVLRRLALGDQSIALTLVNLSESFQAR